MTHGSDQPFEMISQSTGKYGVNMGGVTAAVHLILESFHSTLEVDIHGCRTRLALESLERCRVEGLCHVTFP